MSTTTITKPADAAEIMGDNFHGADETNRFLGAQLSFDDLQNLMTVRFSPAVLEESREDYVLVACASLSLIDVLEAHPELFYAESNFGYEKEAFAVNKVEAGWQLVRKNPIIGSIDKTWDEQCELLGPDEQVPSASVLAQAIVLHYLKTGERLFEKVYVRTSDMSFTRDHVDIGYFNHGGLGVHYDLGRRRGVRVALAASRDPLV